jgi:hypothetical protein
VQRCATMPPQPCPRARAAANQVRATIPPGGMVAGVHTERVSRRWAPGAYARRFIRRVLIARPAYAVSSSLLLAISRL